MGCYIQLCPELRSDGERNRRRCLDLFFASPGMFLMVALHLLIIKHVPHCQTLSVGHLLSSCPRETPRQSGHQVCTQRI